MSLKRTHAQMTGMDSGSHQTTALEQVKHSDYFLQTQVVVGNLSIAANKISLQDKNTVVVKFGPLSELYRVSRTALSSVSGWFAKEFSTKDTWVLSAYSETAFQLFLQWLYYDRYQEYDCYVPGLYDGSSYYSLQQRSDNTGNNMAWRVKAALLAYRFAIVIEAPKFQNYAMARLYRAYQVNDPKTRVTPTMYQWAECRAPMVTLFLEDVVIRNWGDQNVVDHKDEGWASVLGTFKHFRTRFAKAVGLSLQERQQEPMVLEKYLVKQD